MTRPHEALAIHETRFFHDSSFVQLEDGRLLHAAGGEFTTSEDGGLTWSSAYRCTDTEGRTVGSSGTSLVRLADDGVGLAGMAHDPEARSPDERTRSTYMVFWRSLNGGRTWEPPVRVSPPGMTTHAYQDVLLRTSSGRLVLPVYSYFGQASGPGDQNPPACGKLVNNQWVSTAAHFYDPHFTCVYVCWSDDDGRTWQRNRDGELMILLDWGTSFSYVNEPSVTEVAPGRLLMLMRTGLGRLFQAWSTDSGETWTRPQPTSLAASPAPAQIRTLPTGHLLAVWNQEGEDEVLRGYNRTRISAAVSRNGGSVWEFYQNVESLHETTRVEPGPIRAVRPAEYHFAPGQPAPERDGDAILDNPVHGRWSYPSVCVLQDRVIIAHTYSIYSEHPTVARLTLSNQAEGSFNQKFKVLPLTWFYGGRLPADNPFLAMAYEDARP
jgi:hypothetical protein